MKEELMNGLKLGCRIEQARREQQLTREKLALQCNITAVHVRHIEDGSRLPSLPVFIAICCALHVSPAYFLADYIDLKTGLPDPYDRIRDLLLEVSPKQAEIVVMTIENMCSLIKS